SITLTKNLVTGNNMNILITGVGGPTPRSFAIALKMQNRYKNARIIATDINPLAIGLYQNDLFSSAYIVPKATDVRYWEAISEVIEKEAIEVAIILPELEVMEWARKQSNGELPCKTFLPSIEVAEILIDKAKMTSILETLDLVPLSYEFDRGLSNFRPL